MECWAGDSPIQIHFKEITLSIKVATEGCGAYHQEWLDLSDLNLLIQLYIYAFFTHALHHPLEETALPPNARHGAVASFAVPWNKVQEAQYWPIVY